MSIPLINAIRDVDAGDRRGFGNGMLASSSNAVFQRKLEQLVREFDELNQDDAQLPFEQRFGTTVVLALRRWQYGLFDQFKKVKV
ncbi:hypothetical protein [Sedimenticola sp.]